MLLTSLYGDPKKTLAGGFLVFTCWMKTCFSALHLSIFLQIEGFDQRDDSQYNQDNRTHNRPGDIRGLNNGNNDWDNTKDNDQIV